MPASSAPPLPLACAKCAAAATPRSLLAAPRLPQAIPPPLSRDARRLGYLNPLLYSIYAKDPTAFNDVLTGDNSCTESACPCPANTGFGAVAGWDAATGLGTPNYEKIKAAITAMGI